MAPPLRPRALLLALSAVLAVAAPALAAPATPLLPGELKGALTPYEVRRRDSVSAIALKHTVNPVRVTKPSAPSLRDGLQAGEIITVDVRQIRPRFSPGMSGIVLNVPEAEVYLVARGQLVRAYPVAVSTPQTPVPLGRTRVVDKTANPTWYVPASIQAEMARAGRRVLTKVPPGPGNPLGPRWIGFWDGSFGFHGTNVPTSIKQYASHGCVRFLAPDIKDLYRRVAVGTPVHIVYQPVKLAVSGNNVWLSCYPDIYKRRYDYAGAVRSLAAQAGVLGRLDWKIVTQAIREADGIVRNISTLRQAPVPSARPTTPLERLMTPPELLDPAPESAPIEPELYRPVPPMPDQEAPVPAELLLERPPAPWYGED